MMFILKEKKDDRVEKHVRWRGFQKIEQVQAEKRRTKKQERMGSNTATFTIMNYCDYQTCAAVNR